MAEKITVTTFMKWVEEFTKDSPEEWPERTLEILNFARKFPGEAAKYTPQILWGYIKARDRFYKEVLLAVPESVRSEYYRAKRRGGSAYKEAHNTLLDFVVQQGIVDADLAKIFRK